MLFPENQKELDQILITILYILNIYMITFFLACIAFETFNSLHSYTLSFMRRTRAAGMEISAGNIANNNSITENSVSKQFSNSLICTIILLWAESAEDSHSFLSYQRICKQKNLIFKTYYNYRKAKSNKKQLIKFDKLDSFSQQVKFAVNSATRVWRKKKISSNSNNLHLTELQSIVPYTENLISIFRDMNKCRLYVLAVKFKLDNPMSKTTTQAQVTKVVENLLENVFMKSNCSSWAVLKLQFDTITSKNDNSRTFITSYIGTIRVHHASQPVHQNLSPVLCLMNISELDIFYFEKFWNTDLTFKLYCNNGTIELGFQKWTMSNDYKNAEDHQLTRQYLPSYIFWKMTEKKNKIQSLINYKPISQNYENKKTVLAKNTSYVLSQNNVATNYDIAINLKFIECFCQIKKVLSLHESLHLIEICYDSSDGIGPSQSKEKWKSSCLEANKKCIIFRNISIDQIALNNSCDFQKNVRKTDPLSSFQLYDNEFLPSRSSGLKLKNSGRPASTSFLFSKEVSVQRTSLKKKHTNYKLFPVCDENSTQVPEESLMEFSLNNNNGLKNEACNNILTRNVSDCLRENEINYESLSEETKNCFKNFINFTLGDNRGLSNVEYAPFLGVPACFEIENCGQMKASEIFSIPSKLTNNFHSLVLKELCCTRQNNRDNNEEFYPFAFAGLKIPFRIASLKCSDSFLIHPSLTAALCPSAINEFLSLNARAITDLDMKSIVKQNELMNANFNDRREYCVKKENCFSSNECMSQIEKGNQGNRPHLFVSKGRKRLKTMPNSFARVPVKTRFQTKSINRNNLHRNVLKRKTASASCVFNRNDTSASVLQITPRRDFKQSYSSETSYEFDVDADDQWFNQFVEGNSKVSEEERRGSLTSYDFDTSLNYLLADPNLDYSEFSNFHLHKFKEDDFNEAYGNDFVTDFDSRHSFQQRPNPKNNSCKSLRSHEFYKKKIRKKSCKKSRKKTNRKTGFSCHIKSLYSNLHAKKDRGLYCDPRGLYCDPRSFSNTSYTSSVCKRKRKHIPKLKNIQKSHSFKTVSKPVNTRDMHWRGKEKSTGLQHSLRNNPLEPIYCISQILQEPPRQHWCENRDKEKHKKFISSLKDNASSSLTSHFSLSLFSSKCSFKKQKRKRRCSNCFEVSDDFLKHSETLSKQINLVENHVKKLERILTEHSKKIRQESHKLKLSKNKMSTKKVENVESIKNQESGNNSKIGKNKITPELLKTEAFLEARQDKASSPNVSLFSDRPSVEDLLQIYLNKIQKICLTSEYTKELCSLIFDLISKVPVKQEKVTNLQFQQHSKFLSKNNSSKHRCKNDYASSRFNDCYRKKSKYRNCYADENSFCSDENTIEETNKNREVWFSPKNHEKKFDHHDAFSNMHGYVCKNNKALNSKKSSAKIHFVKKRFGSATKFIISDRRKQKNHSKCSHSDIVIKKVKKVKRNGSWTYTSESSLSDSSSSCLSRKYIKKESSESENQTSDGLRNFSHHLENKRKTHDKEKILQSSPDSSSSSRWQVSPDRQGTSISLREFSTDHSTSYSNNVSPRSSEKYSSKNYCFVEKAPCYLPCGKVVVPYERIEKFPTHLKKYKHQNIANKKRLHCGYMSSVKDQASYLDFQRSKHREKKLPRSKYLYIGAPEKYKEISYKKIASSDTDSEKHRHHKKPFSQWSTQSKNNHNRRTKKQSFSYERCKKKRRCKASENSKPYEQVVSSSQGLENFKIINFTLNNASNGGISKSRRRNLRNKATSLQSVKKENNKIQGCTNNCTVKLVSSCYSPRVIYNQEFNSSYIRPIGTILNLHGSSQRSRKLFNSVAKPTTPSALVNKFEHLTNSKISDQSLLTMTSEWTAGESSAMTNLSLTSLNDKDKLDQPNGKFFLQTDKGPGESGSLQMSDDFSCLKDARSTFSGLSNNMASLSKKDSFDSTVSYESNKNLDVSSFIDLRSRASDFTFCDDLSSLLSFETYTEPSITEDPFETSTSSLMLGTVSNRKMTICSSVPSLRNPIKKAKQNKSSSGFLFQNINHKIDSAAAVEQKCSKPVIEMLNVMNPKGKDLDTAQINFKHSNLVNLVEKPELSEVPQLQNEPSLPTDESTASSKTSIVSLLKKIKKIPSLEQMSSNSFSKEISCTYNWGFAEKIGIETGLDRVSIGKCLDGNVCSREVQGTECKDNLLRAHEPLILSFKTLCDLKESKTTDDNQNDLCKSQTKDSFKLGFSDLCLLSRRITEEDCVEILESKHSMPAGCDDKIIDKKMSECLLAHLSSDESNDCLSTGRSNSPSSLTFDNKTLLETAVETRKSPCSMSVDSLNHFLESQNDSRSPVTSSCVINNDVTIYRPVSLKHDSPDKVEDNENKRGDTFDDIISFELPVFEKCSKEVVPLLDFKPSLKDKIIMELRKEFELSGKRSFETTDLCKCNPRILDRTNGSFLQTTEHSEEKQLTYPNDSDLNPITGMLSKCGSDNEKEINYQKQSFFQINEGNSSLENPNEIVIEAWTSGAKTSQSSIINDTAELNNVNSASEKIRENLPASHFESIQINEYVSLKEHSTSQHSFFPDEHNSENDEIERYDITKLNLLSKIQTNKRSSSKSAFGNNVSGVTCLSEPLEKQMKKQITFETTPKITTATRWGGYHNSGYVDRKQDNFVAQLQHQLKINKDSSPVRRNDQIEYYETFTSRKYVEPIKTEINDKTEQSIAAIDMCKDIHKNDPKHYQQTPQNNLTYQSMTKSAACKSPLAENCKASYKTTINDSLSPARTCIAMQNFCPIRKPPLKKVSAGDCFTSKNAGVLNTNSKPITSKGIYKSCQNSKAINGSESVRCRAELAIANKTRLNSPKKSHNIVELEKKIDFYKKLLHDMKQELVIESVSCKNDTQFYKRAVAEMRSNSHDQVNPPDLDGVLRTLRRKAYGISVQKKVLNTDSRKISKFSKPSSSEIKPNKNCEKRFCLKSKQMNNDVEHKVSYSESKVKYGDSVPLCDIIMENEKTVPNNIQEHVITKSSRCEDAITEYYLRHDENLDLERDKNATSQAKKVRKTYGTRPELNELEDCITEISVELCERTEIQETLKDSKNNRLKNRNKCGWLQGDIVEGTSQKRFVTDIETLRKEAARRQKEKSASKFLLNKECPLRRSKPENSKNKFITTRNKGVLSETTNIQRTSLSENNQSNISYSNAKKQSEKKYKYGDTQAKQQIKKLDSNFGAENFLEAMDIESELIKTNVIKTLQLNEDSFDIENVVNSNITTNVSRNLGEDLTEKKPGYPFNERNKSFQTKKDNKKYNAKKSRPALGLQRVNDIKADSNSGRVGNQETNYCCNCSGDVSDLASLKCSCIGVGQPFEINKNGSDSCFGYRTFGMENQLMNSNSSAYDKNDSNKVRTRYGSPLEISGPKL